MIYRWGGLIVCFASLFPSSGTYAQSSPGFGFLQLESSTRAAALGGSAAILDAHDLGAFFYNPALLNADMHGTLSITWLNHLSDLQAGFVSYSHDFGPLGSAAAGVRFLHWGSVPRADEQGAVDGTFTASDLALSVGFARNWQHGVRYGINLHTVYSSVAEYGALAMALDAGVAWHVPSQQVTIAGSLNYLGRALSSLGGVRDRLPLDVRVSVSKRLRHIPLIAALTLHDLRYAPSARSTGDFFSHTILSLEFQASSAFHLRVGYSHDKRELKSASRLDLAGIGAGFGLRIRRFQFDYAFTSWSFAELHQLTLGTRL